MIQRVYIHELSYEYGLYDTISYDTILSLTGASRIGLSALAMAFLELSCCSESSSSSLGEGGSEPLDVS